jgi:Zn-finger in ubiquitin-hydrolases and other protein
VAPTVCEDIASLGAEPKPSTEDGCEDCLSQGTGWVHLRLCLTCGKVGCCDSSPEKHASRHAAQAGHPVIRSFEPGESWRWCFVHNMPG